MREEDMNWIAKLRQDLGMTQDELGALVFVDGSTVSRWEIKEDEIRPDRMALLNTLRYVRNHNENIGRQIRVITSQYGLLDALAFILEKSGHGGWVAVEDARGWR
jgi:transcriptional regulator with XRE-family HTH domain